MSERFPSHEARAHIFAVLDEFGFGDEVDRLVQDVPPRSHELADAMGDTEYRRRIDELAQRWDLDASWFREYVHIAAWNATGRTPRVTYGHHLPAPWGGIDVAFSLVPLGEPPHDLSPQTTDARRVLWATSRKEDVWRSLRSTFDSFWAEVIVPQQERQDGYSTRSRGSDDMRRNALAYLLRARLRRERRTPHADLAGEVAEGLEDFDVDVPAPESLMTALSRFQRLLFETDT